MASGTCAGRICTSFRSYLGRGEFDDATELVQIQNQNSLNRRLLCGDCGCKVPLILLPIVIACYFGCLIIVREFELRVTHTLFVVAMAVIGYVVIN
jgi:hypothetical protein